MKQKLLFIALLISSMVSAQSIQFTSTLTEAQIGTTVTINYQYTIPADGNIYCAINLYDEFTWTSKVVDGSLSPAAAGTDVTGSFEFTIPEGTAETSSLTGNLNYKLVIELSDAGWNWMAGDYPATEINLTNSVLNVDSFENELNKIEIYPNPAFEVLHIKNFDNLNITNVKITNLLGKQVNTSLVEQSNIDISNLNPGIYILSLKFESATKNIKFIKQ